MRFIYIAEIFPQHGETWIRHEVEALCTRGHAVRVYTLRRPTVDLALPTGIEVLALPDLPKIGWVAGLPGLLQAVPLFARLALAGLRPRNALRAGRALVQAAAVIADLRRFRPDLIVCHFAGNRALVGALLARATGLSYLLITHARDVYCRRPEVPALAAAATEIWTISQFNVDYLRDLYPTQNWSRLRHVRVGIDLSVFPFDPAPNADGPLVFVARMVPKKGPELLVDACALLRKRGWKGKAVLIGDGPMLSMIQARVRSLGLAAQVEILGSQPSSVVAEQLARAAAFVLPCRRVGDDMDGIPLAIMEAMAVGTPVVTTAISGIPELVRDGLSGVVVGSDNVAALADGIERVLMMHASERMEMVGVARSAVEQLHDVRLVADQLERVAGGSTQTRQVGRPPRIFVLLDYYIPGFKSGGPLRTISNTVDRLGDQLSFFIFTRDRDATDAGPYSGIQHGVWNQVGHAQVYYAAPNELNAATIRRLIGQVAPDIVYLNSFFSKLTLMTLGLRRLGVLPVPRVLIAPRGELSPGALGLKRAKKRAFLRLAPVIGFYRNLCWQATSEGEVNDIRQEIGSSADVLYVPNLPERAAVIPQQTTQLPKQSGSVRIAFLSRIAEKKNLHYLLELLPQVVGSVSLEVYGPIRESAYWQRCESIIAKLPDHIQVKYRGPLEHNLVSSTLAGYDFFALPTLGENFGHAILEALAAGCPPLISDQTPWRNLEPRQLGWDLPLGDPARWVAALQQCVDMDNAEYRHWSESARRFAADYQAAVEAERATLEMFAPLYERPTRPSVQSSAKDEYLW